MHIDPKHKSHDLTDGPGRAPARAMLKAVGFTDDDLARPLVGVANTWIEVMPCNYHLRRLAEKVKAGIRAAGGTPIEYNTIAVSDGISMGTEGMKASLISREVIADSIELVARGHLFDAVVALSGCDKTIPGTVMALARLNVPSLMLYGGSIMPGRFQGHDVTIQDVFEAVGKHAAGKMSRFGTAKIWKTTPARDPGACGGQFTANTMAIAFEFLGISPMGRNGVPAMDKHKDEVAFQCGQMVMDLLKKDLRPSPDHHPEVAGERDRRRGDHRRLDECRAAFVGHRAGSRHEVDASTTSTRSIGKSRCSPTSSPAGDSWPPISLRPVARRWLRNDYWMPESCIPASRRLPGGRLAKKRNRPSRRQDNTCCGLFPIPSRRPAAWSSSKATSRRKAAW